MQRKSYRTVSKAIIDLKKRVSVKKSIGFLFVGISCFIPVLGMDLAVPSETLLEYIERTERRKRGRVAYEQPSFVQSAPAPQLIAAAQQNVPEMQGPSAPAIVQQEEQTLSVLSSSQVKKKKKSKRKNDDDPDFDPESEGAIDGGYRPVFHSREKKRAERGEYGRRRDCHGRYIAQGKKYKKPMPL